MDPSSAPWRAFETVDPGAPDDAPGTGRGPAAAGPARRHATGSAGRALRRARGDRAPRRGRRRDGLRRARIRRSSSDPAERRAASRPMRGDQPRRRCRWRGGQARRLPPAARVADQRCDRRGRRVRSAGRCGTDVAALNLASPLEDGEQIQVPSRDDPAGDGAAAPGGSPVRRRPGHLGAAAWSTSTAPRRPSWRRCPASGPVTAGKIIASRETTPFTAVQDLRDRKLVGQKTFDGLKDLVTVR